MSEQPTEQAIVRNSIGTAYAGPASDVCGICGLIKTPGLWQPRPHTYGTAICHCDDVTAEAERISDAELDAIARRVRRSRELIDDLCQRRRDWSLSIPVQPTDPDQVLAASLDDLDRLAARFRELKREYAAVRWAADGINAADDRARRLGVIDGMQRGAAFQCQGCRAGLPVEWSLAGVARHWVRTTSRPGASLAGSWQDCGARALQLEIRDQMRLLAGEAPPAAADVDPLGPISAGPGRD